MFNNLILLGTIFAIALITAIWLRRKQVAAERHGASMSAGTITDDLPAGIWQCNAAGLCQSGNRFWRELVQGQGDSWQDLGWIDAFVHDQRENIRREWVSAVSLERPIDVVWPLPEDGEQARWLRIQASPQFDRQGTLQSYLCIATDATAAVEREAALEQRCKHARERGEDHAQFLASMSHDLRTPLSGVIGYTELLRATDLDPQQAHQLDVMAEAGRTMIALIDDIMEAARGDSDQLTIRPAPVALADILHHCFKLLEPSALAKGIKLSLFLDEAIPPQVELDRIRLRQMVCKLLANAIKFTDEGGIDLEARTETTSEGTFLLLSVIDTGIGIAADRLEAILKPYQQDGKSVPSRSGGQGLGLAITDQLASAMGGKLVVHSKQGVGSSFTLRLPLRLPLSHPSHSRTARVRTLPYSEHVLLPHPLPLATPLAGSHVLLVEDDEVSQHLFATIAPRLGIKVSCVPNGEDCLHAIECAQADSQPFQAVLMDVQLPGIDGLETTRRLRARGYDPINLPVIALTGNAPPEFAEQCQNAGMQSHLSKPVSSLALARELAKCLVPPTDGAAYAEHSARKDLAQRYVRRKSLVIASLRASLDNQPETTDWEALAEELHRLAGVAAQFGESELGEMSRALEQSIKRSHDALTRHEYLRKAWPELKRVA